MLQELEVGQKQQVWVQSQTTFACVAKNEEGQHMCKVLKQKIWVEGISYELQEIYGMEHASDGHVKTQVCNFWCKSALSLVQQYLNCNRWITPADAKATSLLDICSASQRPCLHMARAALW